MIARLGFPSSVKSVILVVICMGLVCFCLLEVVVFGIAPVDLWTVLCVDEGLKVVGAVCGAAR